MGQGGKYHYLDVFHVSYFFAEELIQRILNDAQNSVSVLTKA